MSTTEIEKSPVKEENKAQGKDVMWPEVRKAFETKRYELCLVGPEIAKRIEDSNGSLDNNIFRLTHMNFLEIAKTKLTALPSQLSRLENLTSLLCHKNEIAEVPADLGKLVNLKNLDFSNNKITQLPEEFKNLKELMTINLSGNLLKSLFPLGDLTKLAVLDVSRNKFEKLPDDIGSNTLENLSEINGSYNEITEIPDNLYELPSLKTLNLVDNKLTQIPSNLSQSNKLKDLLVKENKLKDNRLKKLVDQDKAKAIIEYLERIYVEEQKSKPKQTQKNTVVNQAVAKKKAKNSDFVVEYDLVKVLHFNNPQDAKLDSKEVTYSESVANLRPYIVCAILRGINLETPGNFKKFLNIQTKIQEEQCQKRTLGTIATHDLRALVGNLTYDANQPDNIQLVPLGRKYPIPATEFYNKLMDEAEAERKAKKRNQLSGIYKYLQLIENHDKFTYMRDEKDVISLPPLTNAEKTKMTTSTKDILVEITSTESLEFSKKIMEDLFTEMIQNGITSDDSDLVAKVEALNVNNDVKSKEATDDESENSKIRHTLIVQQVKILDSKGALKLVYPSRIDLNFDGSNKVRVVRLYDEQN